MGSKSKAASIPSITVANTVKKVLSEGVGWNADNVWNDENHVDGFIQWNDADWQRYNALVGWLKPGFVRFGVCMPYWSPEFGAFTYDSNWMQNNYKQLDAFKAMDTSILLGNWATFAQGPYDLWWSEVQHGAGTDPNSDPRDDYPYDINNFTDAIADGVEYLVNTKGYSNIKYVSLWNEPSWFFVSPTASYPLSIDGSGVNTFWLMYQPLADALERRGLRESIGITGPEVHTVVDFGSLVKTQLQSPAEPPVPTEQKFGQVLDQVAFHDYESFFDYDTMGFDGVSNYRSMDSIVALLRDIQSSVSATYTESGKTPPDFIMGEIGNNGYAATYFDDASSLGDAGVFNAEQTVRLLAEGFDGILRWSLPVTTRLWSTMNTAFRPILYDASADEFILNGASYYSGAIITRYMQKSASVFDYSASGETGTQRIFTVPLQMPDGNWTVFVVNDDFEPRQLQLDLSATGVAQDTTFHEFIWSAGSPDGIYCNREVQYQGHSLNISLDARSVMAFTTLGVDEFVAGSMITPDGNTPVTNYVQNSGFESGELSPWTSSGEVLVENNPVWASSGNHFCTLGTATAPSSISQSLGGLEVGNYVLQAYVRTGSNSAVVGVQGLDGDTAHEATLSTNNLYQTVSIPFAVPVAGGSAEIYMEGDVSEGAFINIDDVSVIKVSGILDGGFESGGFDYWNAEGDAAVQELIDAHSGSFVASISTDTRAGACMQTVQGLAPGSYSFTAYARCGAGASAGIRVTGYGGQDVASTTTNTYWTRLRILFTVPQGSSSATLYFEAGVQAGGWVNGDDFELRPIVEVPQKYIYDTLYDFSLIQEHSENLTFDTATPEAMGGDTNRLIRTTATEEYVVYNTPTEMARAAIMAFFWPNEPEMDFEFQVSPNNINYTTIVPRRQTEVGLQDISWKRVDYLVDEFPAGSNYLKIIFKNNSENAWNPQLGNVILYYA